MNVDIDLVDSEDFDISRLEGPTGSPIPADSASAAWKANRGCPIRTREQDPLPGHLSGMQIAVIEFAGISPAWTANSAEFDPETPLPGGRPAAGTEGGLGHGRDDEAGADPVKLHEGTRAPGDIRRTRIYKRHRHRYEVNNSFAPVLRTRG